MLYFDCKMGAAGDMIMAALYDLMNQEQRAEFIKQMNRLFPGIVKVTPIFDEKCGVGGTHMIVEVYGQEETPHENPHEEKGHQEEEHHHNEGHHKHYTYREVSDHIASFELPKAVIDNITAVYRIIGEAEAKVHGTDLDNIHFHEVGSLDAICDVTGACLAIHLLNEREIYSSPIHVGNGTVKCAHGTLPVPAPATKEILGNVPYYKGNIETELCTPTGAAVLTHFCRFVKEDLPAEFESNIIKTGVGTGHKNLSKPNVLKVYRMKDMDLKLNEDQTKSVADAGDLKCDDRICELSCNLDDMTGEAIGFAMDRLLEQGALDVYYQPIYMKKNRPGIIFTVLCPADQKDKFSDLILKYTTTRGLRYQYYMRDKLESYFEEIQTECGAVRKKISCRNNVRKEKYEYEDVCKIAKALGLSYTEAERYIRKYDA